MTSLSRTPRASTLNGPDSVAIRDVLAHHERATFTASTRPHLNIGGQYRLEVEASTGRLLAVHGATGLRKVLFDPTTEGF